jgi:hypothetical protein
VPTVSHIRCHFCHGKRCNKTNYLLLMPPTGFAIPICSDVPTRQQSTFAPFQRVCRGKYHLAVSDDKPPSRLDAPVCSLQTHTPWTRIRLNTRGKYLRRCSTMPCSRLATYAFPTSLQRCSAVSSPITERWECHSQA